MLVELPLPATGSNPPLRTHSVVLITRIHPSGGASDGSQRTLIRKLVRRPRQRKGRSVLACCSPRHACEGATLGNGLGMEARRRQVAARRLRRRTRSSTADLDADSRRPRPRFGAANSGSCQVDSAAVNAAGAFQPHGASFDREVSVEPRRHPRACGSVHADVGGRDSGHERLAVAIPATRVAAARDRLRNPSA